MKVDDNDMLYQVTNQDVNLTSEKINRQLKLYMVLI